MGYSYCRFECGIPDEEIGAGHYFDAEWIWPVGLVHYIEHHAVRLPDEFIATMRANNWQIPPDMVFNWTPRKVVGYWRNQQELEYPDPRNLVQPDCYGDDLEKIVGYLTMKDYVPPRSTIKGTPLTTLYCSKLDESFWRAWAKERDPCPVGWVERRT